MRDKIVLGVVVILVGIGQSVSNQQAKIDAFIATSLSYQSKNIYENYSFCFMIVVVIIGKKTELKLKVSFRSRHVQNLIGKKDKEKKKEKTLYKLRLRQKKKSKLFKMIMNTKKAEILVVLSDILFFIFIKKDPNYTSMIFYQGDLKIGKLKI
ncbi:hypothetical protein BpHYR1_029490 [Brachionus plicatilis]|uniref:Uncharacterized protein n=1 Tax=Brachionus plicatilis TaxID=10195 RepID=A0A3M7RXM8_BRAPC|nr:hypothetical protein BpHYR1_029490 [Brachionus plicatilis]